MVHHGCYIATYFKNTRYVSALKRIGVYGVYARLQEVGKGYRRVFQYTKDILTAVLISSR